MLKTKKYQYPLALLLLVPLFVFPGLLVLQLMNHNRLEVRIDDVDVHDGQSLEFVYTILKPENLASRQIHTAFVDMPFPTKNELASVSGKTYSGEVTFGPDAAESDRHRAVLQLIRKNTMLLLDEEMPGRFGINHPVQGNSGG